MELQDYEYLINCHDILHTCQEALKENDLSMSSVILTELSHYKDCLEDESVPKSLSSITSTTSSNSAEDDGGGGDDHHGASLTIDDTGGQLKASSVIEFSLWLDRVEKQLNSVCHCKLSNEVRKDAVASVEAISKEVQSVGRRVISAIGSSAKGNKKSSLFAKEEARWHHLWLKSLETLMIIENQKCPKHFGIRPDKRNISSNNSSGFSSIGLSPLSNKSSCETGTDSTPETRAVLMRNRRIQTMMSGGYDSILHEMKGSKFEIVQKDIGYSSDADMSDACEQSNFRRSNTCVNLSSSTSPNNETGPRKRYNKRRRSSRVIRRRPWSFHGALNGVATTQWIDEWDYYQPPSLIECKSSEDLFESGPFDDENTVRSLTEFGENYENWFAAATSEDELVRSSTPISSSCFDDDESGIASQGDKKKVYKDKKNFSSIGTDVCCPIQTESQGVQSDPLPSPPPTVIVSPSAPKTSKKSSSRTVWITISIITLFLSIFFAASNYSPHIELTYTGRNPPPI